MSEGDRSPNADLDWEDAFEEAADDDTDEQPHVPFVPLKEVTPSIPPREFATYICLLVIFMVNLRSQNLTEDYGVNAGVKGMVKLHGLVGSFDTIETVEDYIAWWPNLRGALKRWDENSRLGGQSDRPVSTDGLNSAAAVLVGRPYITQKRQLSDATPPGSRFLGNASEDRGLPGFNASRSATCPWPLDPISQTCYYRSTSKTWSSSWAIFGGTTCAKSCSSVAAEDQLYYLPDITGVINGTYDWDPSNWIDPTTSELGHHFTLYLAGNRRFATGTIVLAWQETGKLTRITEFETHEPFAHETNPFRFYLEMFFFAVIIYHLREEFAELWDCICLTELLLPLEILATSLELDLLRIQFVHERTAEVYDPRDPETEKGFAFPDPEDMRKHYEETIVPRQNLKGQLELELATLKITMEQEPKPISRSTHNGYHNQVQKILEKLLAVDAAIRLQTRIGDAAVNLQLAVMWANKWQMNFPQSFLKQLAGLQGEPADLMDNMDGRSAFCAINWIDVARAYVEWDAPDLNEDGQHRGDDAVDGVPSDETQPNSDTFDQEDSSATTPRNFEQERATKPRSRSTTGPSPRALMVQHAFGDASPALEIADSTVSPRFGGIFKQGLASSGGSRNDKPTLQMKRFAQVAPFVDYLQMLKNALRLHVNMMHAAHLKHWNGPRGSSLSMTIQRAHQALVKNYNMTGHELQSLMKRFPDEISKGFHDPNPVKAMTIKIKIDSLSRLLANLFDDAGMLGFFFPGSPMWEVRRKYFETGNYTRSQSFWKSILPSLGSETGMVAGSSMQLYLHQELDEDGVTKDSGQVTSSNPLYNENEQQSLSPRRVGTGRTRGDGSPVSEKTTALNGGLVQPSKLVHHTDGLQSISMSEEAGTKGWLDWVPQNYMHMVNHDGQIFLDVDDAANAALQKSFFVPLWCWVKRGILTKYSPHDSEKQV